MTTASDGWCPFAQKSPTTKFWSGNRGRLAVVLHISTGGYSGTVSWLSNDQSNPDSSAHFVVATDGRIAQLVSINDSAWANGLHWENNRWTTPTGRVVSPPWPDLLDGVNPNWYTISIEHEGQPQDTWTPEMYDADVRLLKWIASQSTLSYVPHRTLIGHCDVDPADRPNCPGPHVRYEQLADDANGVMEGASQSAINAAKQYTWMPINTDGALYKFALQNNLGYPQTDEFSFNLGSDAYLGQVFSVGIAYVKSGDWANVQWVAKPGDGPLPTDPAARAAVLNANRQLWMPINMMGALYKYAVQSKLGYPQTDEFDFKVGADSYVGQVYFNGIVFAQVGDWSHIRAVRKPQ